MLEIQNLTSGYGRSTVLRNVSLTVPKGQITAVLGHNGAGKSTLLKTLIGILPAQSGRITFEGQDLTRVPANRRVRAGLAFVAQGQQSFGDLTTAENLQLVADGRPDARQAISEALDLFPMLKPVLRKRAGLLSGGQRQQLALARALIPAPRTILLDEPTEGIQPSVVAEIEDFVQNLASETGIGILLVEQHIAFAVKAATEFHIMESGQISHQGQVQGTSVGEIRSLLTV